MVTGSNPVGAPHGTKCHSQRKFVQDQKLRHMQLFVTLTLAPACPALSTSWVCFVKVNIPQIRTLPCREPGADCRAGVDRDTGHALIGNIVCRAEGQEGRLRPSRSGAPNVADDQDERRLSRRRGAAQYAS